MIYKFDFKLSFLMVLKIGEFFTRSKSWANVLQNENITAVGRIIYKEYILFFQTDSLT